MKQAPPKFRAWWLAGLLAAGAAQAQAQTVPASLADLDLEQLASIQVTSVGKRVQRLADVAGSVSVITQEDIRRSGALVLPELLRLAPNLQVARADANQYAITARGFNSVLANKILVLVDGRTVYSPLFSGVFWEAQDLVLEDIERIEVLSGAGGTLYGSNAVNGVVNIITRNAAETTGGLLKAGGGNQESVLAARGGGGSSTGTPWRAYAKRYTTGATTLESGGSTNDAGERIQAGFRLDQARERDQLTLQGDVYRGEFDQAAGTRSISGANLLGRWSREHGAGRRTQLQAWFDRASRRQPGSIDDTLDTWDVELQQASRPGEAHELLWGAGYRLEHDRLTNIAPAALLVLPTERWLHLWNVFAQDEIHLAPALRLTAGLKAEHNSYTGLEWLPNLRLAWQPLANHLLWASASRAVRTPARVDRDVSVPGRLQANPAFTSEVAQVFELGWRGQPRSTLSYTFTLFHHRFQRLRSVDQLPTSVLFGNNYHGRLSGIEAWGNWRLAPQWRLNAGYTWQRLRLDAEAGSSATPASAAQLGNDPRNRGQLGLAWDLAHNMELDLQLRHVGALPDPLVPAYTALDLRWAWRVRPDLELSLAGRNLTDPRHPEWGAAGNRAEIPRSFVLKAVWRL
ncbi:TonB-dependent receptor [Ramlibacter sp. XY19]|uniref:TonB-dependent receptor plug domain-containing protein n=1 Tax=Ramlibacter paludis TaxID=2908000 RepID=UPI0023DA5B86|nr:TonB-dependent receptor [Ramlibacter paludis]MCG2594493.1 TonB-dependent receptor [Ramlibacter paludis]